MTTTSRIPASKRGSCAGCGAAIYVSKTSAAEPRCRLCRRALVQHGSLAMYQKRGCRCEACRAANAASMREYAADYRARTGTPLWDQYRKDGLHVGSWIGKRRRLAIYERDGWKCWICGRAVNREAHPNADDAPSLDHVTPLSRGGSHEDRNLSCAHRACNSKRGAPDVVA